MLLGEEDCLGEVDFVEVSKMFVVEVVAVSPHVEGEMDVDSDDMSREFVHAKGCEIREMSHIVELDEEAIRRQNPRRDPVVDLMRDEVDPILDKITDQGMHSLTDEERRILSRASRQISRKEKR